MKRFLERNLPPGYAYKTELLAVTGAFLWAALSSGVSFSNAYVYARGTLYIQRGTDSILDVSRVMPDFLDILGDKLLSPLLFGALILVGTTVIHYAYFHSGGKSIYLMRRLPNKAELHRRSLLIPLLSALIFVLLAFVLFLVYYAVYMNFTPAACLAPDQWLKIRSVFR
jgi:hypothetical protein